MIITMNKKLHKSWQHTGCSACKLRRKYHHHRQKTISNTGFQISPPTQGSLPPQGKVRQTGGPEGSSDLDTSKLRKEMSPTSRLLFQKACLAATPRPCIAGGGDSWSISTRLKCLSILKGSLSSTGVSTTLDFHD